MQQRPLRELGAWLDTNGEAIFGTRSWTRTSTTTADGQPVWFTEKDGTLYAIILAGRLGDTVAIRDLVPPEGTPIGFLGEEGNVAWTQSGSDLLVKLPPRLSSTHAPVLVMRVP